MGALLTTVDVIHESPAGALLLALPHAWNNQPIGLLHKKTGSGPVMGLLRAGRYSGYLCANNAFNQCGDVSGHDPGSPRIRGALHGDTVSGGLALLLSAPPQHKGWQHPTVAVLARMLPGHQETRRPCTAQHSGPDGESGGCLLAKR